MRIFTALLPLLFAVIPRASAQGSSLNQAIASLPNCAITCLASVIQESPCKLSDQKCICTNAELQANVEACVLGACTIKESLITKNVTQTTCGAPIRSKVVQTRAINIALAVVSASFGLTRFIYKLVYSAAELGLDDYTIMATLIAGVPSAVIIDRGATANGLGRDIWTLSSQTITNFIRYFYTMEILYFLQIGLLKLSLLFFYQRIFPARNVRLVILATLVFNILYTIAFVVAAIFQCRPISFYWKRWDGQHEGHCIDVNALAWANAGISIALDLWMLAIPLYQVLHLQLSWRKKIGVTLMFCVGTFVTVVSILRLKSLVGFANTLNPTWDQLETTNWSTIEINVGVMCACLPAIRVMLVRFFPRLMGTTKNTAQQYYAKYGSQSHPQSFGQSSGSGLGSVITKDKKSSRPMDPSAITYTQTYEVHHGDRGDGDELQLVEMNEFGPKKSVLRSGSSSEHAGENRTSTFYASSSGSENGDFDAGASPSSSKTKDMR